MKAFKDLALSRRSIRKYTNEKINDECIKEIISKENVIVIEKTLSNNNLYQQFKINKRKKKILQMLSLHM